MHTDTVTLGKTRVCMKRLINLTCLEMQGARIERLLENRKSHIVTWVWFLLPEILVKEKKA